MTWLLIASALTLCQGLPTTVNYYSENGYSSIVVTNGTSTPNDIRHDGDLDTYDDGYRSYGNGDEGYFTCYTSMDFTQTRRLEDIGFGAVVSYNSSVMTGFPNQTIGDFGYQLWSSDYNYDSVFAWNLNTSVQNNYFTNVQYVFNCAVHQVDVGRWYNYSFTFDLWRAYSGSGYYHLYSLDELYANGLNESCEIVFSVSWHIVDLEQITTGAYNDGYNVGHDSGYAEGYNYGFSLGNDSNGAWRNLLGAIIDTPILYLRKFFGYEVFGVNIYGLLATLISLIVALSVFRLIRSIV